MLTKLDNKNKLQVKKNEISPFLQFVDQLLGGIIVINFEKWYSL